MAEPFKSSTKQETPNPLIERTSTGLALSPAVQVAVAAIVLLGMLGGCLIVAHSGFATSPRRGGASVFVPAPQAYLLAATMYGMSAIGLLALLRARQSAKSVIALAAVLYVCVAGILTVALR